MLRVKSFLGMLAALPALSNAAVLQLVGESSTLEMNGAKLRSWCTTDESAEVLGMTPTEFRGIVGGNVTVLFRNVPATCVNSPISQPCAESLGILPPLFQCHLNGPGGSFSTAEDRAFTRVVKPTEGSSDLILGTAIVMSCPLPPHETLVSVAGYQGETGEAWVHLNITYSGVEIPFAGVPDGSRIHFFGTSQATFLPSSSSRQSSSITAYSSHSTELQGILRCWCPYRWLVQSHHF